jgi:hypothetical protein
VHAVIVGIPNPLLAFIIGPEHRGIKPKQNTLAKSKLNLTHVYVRNVILLLTLTNHKFSASTEQDCAIFAIHMLKDISYDAGLRKNVEAEVMVVTLEPVIVLVLVRVIFL